MIVGASYLSYDTNCLNPYCNGCTSMMRQMRFYSTLRTGLNPYCNGCTSMMKLKKSWTMTPLCLNPYCNGCTSMISPTFS
mgnify:CR=1 FL=1